jgi:hypothetical protein
VQELGSPIIQLFAFIFLALTLALSWYLDRMYKASTSLPFIFPDADNNYLEELESRRRGAKAIAGLWWFGALAQLLLVFLAGYLILSVNGAIAFMVLFGFFKFIAGFLYFRKPRFDTLGSFERLLETTASIMPLTTTRLKKEIERCVHDGLLRPEDYELLLQHLGGRTDAIGDAARQLADGSVALE